MRDHERCFAIWQTEAESKERKQYRREKSQEWQHRHTQACRFTQASVSFPRRSERSSPGWERALSCLPITPPTAYSRHCTYCEVTLLYIPEHSVFKPEKTKSTAKRFSRQLLIQHHGICREQVWWLRPQHTMCQQQMQLPAANTWKAQNNRGKKEAEVNKWSLLQGILPHIPRAAMTPAAEDGSSWVQQNMKLARACGREPLVLCGYQGCSRASATCLRCQHAHKSLMRRLRGISTDWLSSMNSQAWRSLSSRER